MKRRWIMAVTLAAIFAMGARQARAVDPAAIERGALELRGASYVESAEMLFDVVAGGVLSLGTTTGSVDVRTWPRDQIRLVVTKWTKADDIESARRILDMFSVRAQHGGKNLKLQALAKTVECAKAVGVEFTIWVPKSYNLDIKTAKGSINLPEVDGTFSAHTNDGKITVDCSTDDLDVDVEDRTSQGPPRGGGHGDGDVEP